MYPSPATAYRPQPQLIPQMTNQNLHPSSPPPPPPPPTSTSSSNYPYYSHNSNAPTSGHPGQPPFIPQPTPYAMGGSTTGATNQQNNNLNGPPSVSIKLNNKFVQFLFFITE
jgi:hypothetical protein